MAGTLQVSIITPERMQFEGPAAGLTMQSPHDSLAILPGHIGLVTLTEAGRAILKGTDGKTTTLEVGPGTLHVKDDRVKILVDSAS